MKKLDRKISKGKHLGNGLKATSKIHKTVAQTLSGTAVLSMGAGHAHAEKLKAWSAPQWGFVKSITEETTTKPTLNTEKALSNSLIFDQPFDKVAFRPWTGVTQQAIVKNLAPSKIQTPIVSAVNELTTQPLANATPISEDMFVKTAALDADLKMRTEQQEKILKKLEIFSGQSFKKAAVAELSGESPSEWNDIQAAALQRKLENMNSVTLEESPSIRLNLSANPKAIQVAKVDKIGLPTFHQPTPTEPTNTNESELKKPSPPPDDVTPKTDVSLSKLVIPKADANLAWLYILDEESQNSAQKLGLKNASISWVGRDSNLITKSLTGGAARAPYHSTKSMRFVVQAPGYLPAVGYASAGLVTPVVLVKESRLGPVIKSLGVVPDSSKVIIFGKVVDAKGNPISNVAIDASIEKPFKVSYSLGSFGLFHPKAHMTGPAGDFFIGGVNPGLQYLMPTQNLSKQNNFGEGTSLDNIQSVEWPATILNMTGVGPAVTVTIQQSELRKLKTQVVDAFLMERPSGVGIQVTLGGQRGLYIPDSDGNVVIEEMYRRATPDLVEIRAQGYVTTWVTGSPEKGAFPDTVAIFTQRQIDTLLAEALPDIQLTKGVVFGNMRAESFNRPVKVQVFDAFGRPSQDAKVLYFDDKNLARTKLEATDPVVQNFAIANLNPGEWQILATDASTGKVVGAQVIRVDMNKISQLQF